MKLLKLTALAVAICLLSTGCNTGSDSPENLLNDNIVYSESKNKLYTFVNQSLDGTTLLLPNNVSEVGEINEVDSNIIAFQKKQDVNAKYTKVKVGFVLISKNGDKYKLEDSYLQEGDDIEYANFYDINNDGKDEVVLLIRKDNATNMYVYSIKNNKIELISEVKPTWLKNYSNFIDTKIKIGFLDDDLTLDILMMNYDINSEKMYATILRYDKDNNISRSNTLEFNNVKNIKELYTTNGKVSNDKKGIVINIPSKKESGYNTQILTLEKDKLSKVFDDDKMIFNSYYVPVKDFNLDGILDLPVLNNNMIENFSTNTTSSALVTWKQWNNKYDDKADTIFISQVYYNYKNNFRLFIQNNLAYKLYIQKSVTGETSFYTFYHYEKNDTEPIEIFQISISPKNIVEDAKTTPKMDTILAESDNNYYQLIINNKEIFESFNLTIESMKESFSLIYK